MLIARLVDLTDLIPTRIVDHRYQTSMISPQLARRPAAGATIPRRTACLLQGSKSEMQKPLRMSIVQARADSHKLVETLRREYRTTHAPTISNRFFPTTPGDKAEKGIDP